MGLDSVELLIEIETTFDIEIPDKEAQYIETVGDFYEAVWNKIKQKESQKCKSAFIFYKLRKILIERYNISKKDFDTNSDLNLLIPQISRRDEWNKIKQSLGLKLPELKFPDWISNIILYFGLSTIIGGLIYAIILINFFDSSKLFLSIPIIGIILTVIINNLLTPSKVRIDGNVRAIINETLKLNNKEISTLIGTNRKEMETVINLVIMDKGGVDLSEIHYDARIVKDLGID